MVAGVTVRWDEKVSVMSAKYQYQGRYWWKVLRPSVDRTEMKNVVRWRLRLKVWWHRWERRAASELERAVPEVRETYQKKNEDRRPIMAAVWKSNRLVLMR